MDVDGVPWQPFESLQQSPRFFYIQGEVVVAAPHSWLLHLFSVVGVIIVCYETHQCCVVCKFYNVVGGGAGSAVVCQQGEGEWAETTALR